MTAALAGELIEQHRKYQNLRHRDERQPDRGASTNVGPEQADLGVVGCKASHQEDKRIAERRGLVEDFARNGRGTLRARSRTAVSPACP